MPNRCKIHATWLGTAQAYKVTWTADAGGGEQTLSASQTAKVYDGSVNTKNGGTVKVYGIYCNTTNPTPATARREAVTATSQSPAIRATNRAAAGAHGDLCRLGRRPRRGRAELAAAEERSSVGIRPCRAARGRRSTRPAAVAHSTTASRSSIVVARTASAPVRVQPGPEAAVSASAVACSVTRTATWRPRATGLHSPEHSSPSSRTGRSSPPARPTRPATIRSATCRQASLSSRAPRQADRACRTLDVIPGSGASSQVRLSSYQIQITAAEMQVSTNNQFLVVRELT